MDNISLFFLIFGLNNHSGVLDDLMIFGARYLIFVAFLLTLFLIFKGTTAEKKAFLLAILALPITVLIIMGIHLFFIEPRPFVTFHFTPLYPFNPDASFPSRHASFMSILAFSYLYFKSKWSMLFLLLMVWVGISRVYVGVHYPIDILGGVLVGIVSLITAEQIVKFLKIKLLSS